MPYFDENPLSKLTLEAGRADHEIDLRGLDVEAAMQRVESLLAEPGLSGSLVFRFDAAKDDGQETLFLPLGRRLLAARRDGQLKRCLPTDNGTAYFVEIGDVD